MRRIGIIVSILLTSSVQAAWLNGWDNRKEITISDVNVVGDLTYFPIYVPITADADMTNAKADGADVRFTLSDGTTILDSELVKGTWSGGNASAATGEFWVSVPSILNTGGATIYMYWGKADESAYSTPTDVWDVNYVAVFHFANGTIIDINDSTSYAIVGTHSTNGDEPGPHAGKVDGGVDIYEKVLEAGSVYISETETQLNLTDDTWTYECWMYADTWPEYAKIYCKEGSESCGIDIEGKRAYLTIRGGKGATLLNYDLSVETWYHLAWIRTTTANVDIYVNGLIDDDFTHGTHADPLDSSVVMAYIGSFNMSSNYNFDGVFDEFRISNKARSAAWIKFTYCNMNSVDHDLTFGAKESDGVTIPILTYHYRSLQ
jgi:hypothetical protein